MYRFFEKISRFMYGRYGIDNLGKFMLLVYVLIAFANIFVPNQTIKFILYGVQFVIFFLFVLRALSRNIYARKRENNLYLKTIGRAEPKIKIFFKRIKDIGAKRYRTCPNCKSISRLPIRRGRHTVRCPHCRREYKVFIMF